ncbi:MAG: protein-L-isoaspartate O-methyltransferase, partial [Candidatus Marinimicrobia bacterium]|nr:protein-L-isoaspartate O-methyltransferase [Candidatus Neomarinimicrobiota bacterium]
MIEDQIIKRGIQDQRVLDIMGRIDRQKFVPEEHVQSANNDGALPIGYGQTISQPFIVAFMSENLKIDASHKVLEIGTGSGYQSAVLSNLCN